MRPITKRIAKLAVALLDVLLLPLVCASAWLLGRIRRIGIQHFPLAKRALFGLGVFPITSHYYEPQFDLRHASRPYSDERELQAIDWNLDGQLAFLRRLGSADELAAFPQHKTGQLEFYFANGAFDAGDADFWYQVIRHFKPRRIVEIGSGMSTLMAVNAVRANMRQNPGHGCRHVCIEPYEAPWLEQLGIEIIRSKVEQVGLSLFRELEENDILFIDSSHVIRPQGDVLFEFMEILPALRKGVVVHVHDIFTPRNYPDYWLRDKIILCNEQYLLEAFLADNPRWQILAALNHLHHHHAEALKQVCPMLEPDGEPGSFYMRKIA